MSRTKQLFILGVVLVITGACLYFTPSGVRESNIQGTQNSLTIRAWTDASYSFGSSKWMFLYQSSFGSMLEANLDFPFPYFPVNPGVAERLCGEPILITVCTTTGHSEMEGRLLSATLEASYTWNGLEIRVSEANPAYVVLSFKPLF
jgi:hypothetical protein